MFKPTVDIEEPAPRPIEPNAPFRVKITNGSINSSEINKVERKIPGWFRAPKQINSTILLSYLKLAENNKHITEQMIKSNCSTINNFESNFTQMINIAEKNHAKVFNEELGYIVLWGPVKKFIINEYITYKKRYNQ